MLRLQHWLGFSVLALACDRTPEPAPIPTSSPIPPASVSASEQVPPSRPLASPAPKTTASSDCPSDPNIAENAQLFGHATITFTTPTGARHAFMAQLATTPHAQEKGLMYRTAIGEQDAMLFDFTDHPHVATFWMHNTCVPLDMVFVGPDFRVQGVVTAPRLNDDPRTVGKIAIAVVELKAGVANQLGIVEGTTLQF
jgi:hypothetical protein